MKRILCTLFLAVALLAVPAAASAQLIKWGLKAGLNMPNPTKKNFDAGLKGETGWFVGPMAEIKVPLIPLSVDGSLLYSQANNKLELDGYSETVKLQYIDIPLNVKYHIGLSSLASFFIAAGPQFSFQLNGNSINDAIDKTPEAGDPEFRGDNKNFQASINLGVGVNLLYKLQVYGGYNFALGDSFTINDENYAVWKSKNNMWKVSVAYLF